MRASVRDQSQVRAALDGIVDALYALNGHYVRLEDSAEVQAVVLAHDGGMGRQMK